MRIAIMGAGAIGSLYGGSLKMAGHDVVLIGRPNHVVSINQSGLKFSGVLGEHSIDIEATANPRDVTQADYVMITTKTYDTINAAREVEHLVRAGAKVVVLQNGLGTERQVAKVLDTSAVLRATTCFGAEILEPGAIEVTGKGLTEIGSHYEENTAAVHEFATALQESGFEVVESDNIEGVVWTKTIVNCGINPVGALTGLTNGEIHSNPALRGLVVKLVEETYRVVKALGVQLTTDDPVRYTLGTAKATGNNINSMLQDIRAMKRTEIESITGAVIRLGRELGVPTPASESVYALVRALESKYLSDDEGEREKPSMYTEELVRAMTRS
ncbi:2-dehydropantoate 2-reductase [Candidatus Thorarchaeota archaeon]|nr:MAG: 2-dehydropantoate 2-reductase [Candidatus Thorarchaeota archaeon]